MNNLSRIVLSACLVLLVSTPLIAAVQAAPSTEINKAINIFGAEMSMDASMPIFFLDKIYIGKMSNESINNWKWIFRIEGEEDYYYFTGIKIWLFMTLPFVIVLVYFIKIAKSDSWLNKAIKKMLNKQEM